MNRQMAESPVSLNDALPPVALVETPFVRDVVDRALKYLESGFAVHFCGPAGTGKTTLALHVARLRGHPTMLIHGDDEFTTTDLVGGTYGYRRLRVLDNYVRTVLKTQEDLEERWTDNRLTIACRQGSTLVYDEFTRSRPEANNVLLSVLAERILTLPAPWGERGYIPVHPDFAAIFTSNPEEYAGVHRAQDALRDRMITISLDYYDRETEVAIAALRADADQETAGQVVDLVRFVRQHLGEEARPSLRASIALVRFCQLHDLRPDPRNETFLAACLDVLSSPAPGGRARVAALLRDAVGPRAEESAAAPEEAAEGADEPAPAAPEEAAEGGDEPAPAAPEEAAEGGDEPAPAAPEEAAEASEEAAEASGAVVPIAEASARAAIAPRNREPARTWDTGSYAEGSPIIGKGG